VWSGKEDAILLFSQTFNNCYDVYGEALWIQTVDKDGLSWANLQWTYQAVENTSISCCICSRKIDGKELKQNLQTQYEYWDLTFSRCWRKKKNSQDVTEADYKDSLFIIN
jgi:hypothetical protein